jgi:hypothetical protein
VSFPCPCCGFQTLAGRPPGSYSLCELCGWEDDLVQFRDPYYEGGANTKSMNQTRKLFAEFLDGGTAASMGFRRPSAEHGESVVLYEHVDGWSRIYHRQAFSRDELELSLQHVIRLIPFSKYHEEIKWEERLLRAECSCGWRSEWDFPDPAGGDTDEMWWDTMSDLCDAHSQTYLLVTDWCIDAVVNEVQMDMSPEDEAFLSGRAGIEAPAPPDSFNVVLEMRGHWTRIIASRVRIGDEVQSEAIRYGVQIGAGPHVIVDSIKQSGGSWSPPSPDDLRDDGLVELPPVECRGPHGDPIEVVRFQDGAKWKAIATCPTSAGPYWVYMKGNLEVPWAQSRFAIEERGAADEGDRAKQMVTAWIPDKRLSLASLHGAPDLVSVREVEAVFDDWLATEDASDVPVGIACLALTDVDVTPNGWTVRGTVTSYSPTPEVPGIFEIAYDYLAGGTVSWSR